MEAPQAAWVSMVMNRLENLEKENDNLRKQLAQKADRELTVTDGTTLMHVIDSSFFYVDIFLDQPHLKTLKDLGIALLNSGFAVYDTTICLDVMNNSDLKRPIGRLTGLSSNTSVSEVSQAIMHAWGSIFVPREFSWDQMYHHAVGSTIRSVHGCYISPTKFGCVWSFLIAEADDVLLFVNPGDAESDAALKWDWQDDRYDGILIRQEIKTAAAIDSFPLKNSKSENRLHHLLTT